MYSMDGSALKSYPPRGSVNLIMKGLMNAKNTQAEEWRPTVLENMSMQSPRKNPRPKPNL